MILIILAISLILRLIALNQSLWLDEGINVNVAKALSYQTLFSQYPLGDFHPPLYHLLLKAWIDIMSPFFQTSEILVRIPSVLLGVGTVFITYLIGKKLFDTKTAQIAATLIATAPLHIYYSQEARMYMLAAFFTSLSCYFFLSIIKKDNLFNWTGFIFSTAVMLYCDYLPYLMVPIYIIFLLLQRKKINTHTLKAFIPAFLLIFFLIIPWLLIFPSQLKGGLGTAAASPAWAQVVGTSTFKDLAITFIKFTIGRISNENKFLYMLFFAPAALYVVLMFFLSLFRMSHIRSFLLYWFFLPVIFAFSFGFIVPVFSYFRLIYVLPAFYLIWAMAANTVNWKPLVRTLLFFGLAINLISATIYFVNPRFQREDWRAATNYVAENTDDKTIALFESNYTVGPFDYYNQGKIPAYGALDSFDASTSDVTKKLKVLTDGKNKVYLFQYLSGITDPTGIVFQRLSQAGFKNTQTKDFNGVGFIYEFKK